MRHSPKTNAQRQASYRQRIHNDAMSWRNLFNSPVYPSAYPNIKTALEDFVPLNEQQRKVKQYLSIMFRKELGK